MQEKDRNIYKKARACAGITQERAAELLELSVESVKAYETGQRLPPGSTVARMAEVYSSPGLRLEHARETDELDLIPSTARPRPLEQTVLRLYNALRSLLTAAPRLAEIAEDGSVGADEAEDFERIEDLIAAVVAAALEARCVQQQRERSTAATVKRSGGTDHKESRPGSPESIIAKSRAASSVNLAGKAVSL